MGSAGKQSRREAARGGGEVEANEQITPAAFCVPEPAAAQAATGRKNPGARAPSTIICGDLGAR